MVASPSSPGRWSLIPGSNELEMTVARETYRLSIEGVIGCYQFNAIRQRDRKPMRGWVPMRHVSMEYTGWRDPWACQM